MVIVVIVVVVLIVPVVGHCSWWHFDCCCYYYYSSTDDPPRHGTTTIFLFRHNNNNNNSTHRLMFLCHDNHDDGYNGYLSWSVQRSRRPSRNHQPQYIHRDLQTSVRCIPVAVTMRVMTMAKRHSHGYSRWYCRCGSCTSPINGVVHLFTIWSILIRPPPPLHHHHHLRCRNYCCRSPPPP